METIERKAIYVTWTSPGPNRGGRTLHPVPRGGFHKAGEGPAFGGLWFLSGSRKEPPAGSVPTRLASRNLGWLDGQPLAQGSHWRAVFGELTGYRKKNRDDAPMVAPSLFDSFSLMMVVFPLLGLPVSAMRMGQIHGPFLLMFLGVAFD